MDSDARNLANLYHKFWKPVTLTDVLHYNNEGAPDAATANKHSPGRNMGIYSGVGGDTAPMDTTEGLLPRPAPTLRFA